MLGEGEGQGIVRVVVANQNVPTRVRESEQGSANEWLRRQEEYQRKRRLRNGDPEPEKPELPPVDVAALLNSKQPRQVETCLGTVSDLQFSNRMWRQQNPTGPYMASGMIPADRQYNVPYWRLNKSAKDLHPKPRTKEGYATKTFYHELKRSKGPSAPPPGAAPKVKYDVELNVSRTTLKF